jgi:Cdc6-like AAA superfamily ATPase
MEYDGGCVTPQEKIEFKVLVSSAFRYGGPIETQKLFVGRVNQLNDVLSALRPDGHLLLFGARGVGKTSFARLIPQIIKAGRLRRQLHYAAVNCEETDTFSGLWKKIFRELDYLTESTEIEFRRRSLWSDDSFGSIAPNPDLDCDDVRYVLGKITDETMIIVDDLEKLTNDPARAQLADTIKILSNHSLNATLILVGTADCPEALFPEYRSMERALAHVQVPRMSLNELVQVINTGLGAGAMTAEDSAIARIARLAHGCPQFVHALGLYSAFSAIESGRTTVTDDDVHAATRTTVQKLHSLHRDYDKATTSPRSENIFSRVLRACALAETDEFGHFSASAVTLPMSRIMGRKYDIPNFSRHLFDFCEPKRGSILKRIGEPRRIRYRFANPMMQAFVVIHDYSNGYLTSDIFK